MPSPMSWLCRLAAALVLAVPLGAAADEGDAQFAPFSGAGNLGVFDPAAGEGGWAGSIDGLLDFRTGAPVSLVSIVNFTFDAATNSLVGSFQFTNSLDLDSMITGTLIGSADNADILNAGGEFALDYTVTGGSGSFTGANGFALSLLDYDPNGAFDNYREAGLLVVAVPEPATVAMFLLGGSLLVWTSRRRRAALHLDR